MASLLPTDSAWLLAVRMQLRTYVRSPLNLVLLAAIPVGFVTAFGASLTRFADSVDIVIPLRSGEALTALWAALFLTALMGMYMRASARQADRRLVLCGLPPLHAATARLTTVAILATLPVAVSFIVLVVETAPAAPLPALAALYLGAVLYAGLGVLIGSVTPTEFEGSFVLMFIFMFDVFLGSPLFANAGVAATLTPARAPSELVIAAVFGTGHATAHWALLGGYAGGVLALAVWSFRKEATA